VRYAFADLPTPVTPLKPSAATPLRHYITIGRDILLKGVGLNVIWPDVLPLLAFAVVAIWVSATRYLSQLR